MEPPSILLVALCDTKMADKTLRLRMAEFSIISTIFYLNNTRIGITNAFKDEKRSTSEIILIFITTSIIVTKLRELTNQNNDSKLFAMT